MYGLRWRGRWRQTHDCIFSLDDNFRIALQAITLVEVQNGGVLDITFTGIREDGTTVTEIVQTEGETDILSDGGSPETYTFVNLSSELFESISFTAVGTGLGFDNIEVQIASPTAVPEPTACWSAILISAFAALVIRRQPIKAL